MTSFIRYNKYEVLKRSDIEKYLSLADKRRLEKIVGIIGACRVAEGKVACHSYIVVNENQPYAEEVWKLIEQQWLKEQATP